METETSIKGTTLSERVSDLERVVGQMEGHLFPATPDSGRPEQVPQSTVKALDERLLELRSRLDNISAQVTLL